MLKSAPAHAAGVLAGKRVALLQEILESIDYPDTTLVSEMVQGFPLTGWMTKSGIFPSRVRRPKFDKSTLVKLAKGINHSTLRSVDRRQDSELEQGAWDETCKELKEGCGKTNVVVVTLSLPKGSGSDRAPKSELSMTARCVV